MVKDETMQALHQLHALLLNFSADPATLNELHDHHQSAMLCLMSDLCGKVEADLIALQGVNHG